MKSPANTMGSGNSTAAETITKTENEKPSLSVAQKFANLSQGAKIAVYCGGGAAAALLLSALIFTCIRQRRAGRRERDAYNAIIEKQREETYREQMELREKGLGGWDKNAYAIQGEDALGGWGGSHVAPGTTTADVPPVPKLPSNVMVGEIPSRSNSPAISRSMSPAIPTFTSPPLAAPAPQSARQWSGGNMQNADNAYTGGYGSSPNIPRSPSFPQQPGYSGGYSQGGYQRF